MKRRWLTGWLTHPSTWIDFAIFAAIGAVLALDVVVVGR